MSIPLPLMTALNGHSTGSASLAAAPSVASAMSRRAEKSLETRTRILDSAEELFSTRGVDGVTLRDIAHLADVDTALLHYYFDSKRGIFEAVLGRRAAILQYEIGQSLSQYESENPSVTIEGVVGAYLHPIFRLVRTGGIEWRNYCSLVVQLGNHGEWVSDTVTAYFDPIAERLLSVLKKGLPASVDADLHWSYHMLARVLTLAFSLDTGIERLSAGACRAGDFEELEPRMVKFAAAGIRGACEPTDV